MSRHVPRRPGDPPRGEFDRLPFHGWYGCRGCGAVVYDWALHKCHEHEDQDPAAEGEAAVTDLAAVARAEGAAVVECSRPRMFGRETWRQVAACVHPRRFRSPRPAASPDPHGAAGRAEQWARIDALIERTTEA